MFADMIATINAGISLLDKGGTVAYILAALSFVAVTIIIAKMVYFYRLHLGRYGPGDLVRLGTASSHAKKTPPPTRHPAIAIVAACIQMEKDAVDPEARDDRIGRMIEHRLRDLESGLPILEMIGNLAPLLGLLGTVIGMIEAFADLENESFNVNVAHLAGGIWKALLTTAIGLCVAVIALVSHYFLRHKVELFQLSIDDAIASLIRNMQQENKQAR